MAKRQTKISKANSLTLSWEVSLQGFLLSGIQKKEGVQNSTWEIITT